MSASEAETILRRFRAAGVRRTRAHRLREAAKGLARVTLMVPTRRHAEIIAVAARMRAEHRSEG